MSYNEYKKVVSCFLRCEFADLVLLALLPCIITSCLSKLEALQSAGMKMKVSATTLGISSMWLKLWQCRLPSRKSWFKEVMRGIKQAPICRCANLLYFICQMVNRKISCQEFFPMFLRSLLPWYLYWTSAAMPLNTFEAYSTGLFPPYCWCCRLNSAYLIPMVS